MLNIIKNDQINMKNFFSFIIINRVYFRNFSKISGWKNLEECKHNIIRSESFFSFQIIIINMVIEDRENSRKIDVKLLLSFESPKVTLACCKF